MLEFNPPEKFISERLFLRRLIMSDMNHVFEFAGNDMNTRYVAWPTHRNINDSKSFLDYSIKSFDEKKEFSYGILIQETEEFIGWIGMKCTEPQVFYIGYFLDHKYWNCGYTTEAAKCLFNWLLNEVCILRIESACHIENIASAKVLEKVGLKIVKKMKAEHPFPNLKSSNTDAFIFEYVK